VVLHYTAMASAAEARARLCDPAHEVSAHYLIDEEGGVEALVPEGRRAWHAGAGSWGGRADVNSRSIGIELSNRGAHPFAHPQMLALEGLLRDVLHRHAMPPERVIGHSDMAPGRKHDPGPRFDWRRLARAGLSVWPEGGRPEGRLEDHLAAFGYDADQPPEALLAAFRLRFRPWARGPLAPEDLAAAEALGRLWPVDGRAGSA
jgi:N-acetylmuramoyl-L-alanine amidase